MPLHYSSPLPGRFWSCSSCVIAQCQARFPDPPSDPCPASLVALAPAQGSRALLARLAPCPVGLQPAAAPALSAALQRGAASVPAIGWTSYFSLWIPSCNVNQRGQFRITGLESQAIADIAIRVFKGRTHRSGKRGKVTPYFERERSYGNGHAINASAIPRNVRTFWASDLRHQPPLSSRLTCSNSSGGECAMLSRLLTTS